jgi:tetratricopeptide (TPR) repeat protein
VESLVGALAGEHAWGECVQTALHEGASLPHGPSYANVVGYGLACASSSSPSDHIDATDIERLTVLTQEAIAIPGLLADDRSGLYESLVAHLQGHDDAAAKLWAERWLTFLEGEAATATTPAARAVFDPHRVSAALALGHPERALPALEQSERDFPTDYNPPAREAVVLRELRRLDDAEAAGQRALKLVYGPRRIRVLQTLASIRSKRSDVNGQRAALQEALTVARALSAAERRETFVRTLEGELAKLPAQAP